MIEVRNRTRLRLGDFTDVGGSNPSVLSYVREFGDDVVLCVNNCRASPAGRTGPASAEAATDRVDGRCPFPPIGSCPICSPRSHGSTGSGWSPASRRRRRSVERLPPCCPAGCRSSAGSPARTADRCPARGAATRLRDQDPEFWYLLVEGSRASEPTSIRCRERSRHPADGSTRPGGEIDGRFVYDALHDKEATAELLSRFESQDRLEALCSPSSRRRAPAGEVSLVLTAEQSNTSLAYGGAALLKVFRRLVPGVNPDVEIHDSLTRAGSEYIAPLLGWLDGVWTDQAGEQHEASLAMLQKFLVTATDGWALATTSVRDLYAEQRSARGRVGGDFAGESQRLGMATAEVHAYLADVLPARVFPPRKTRRWRPGCEIGWRQQSGSSPS